MHDVRCNTNLVVPSQDEVKDEVSHIKDCSSEVSMQKHFSLYKSLNDPDSFKLLSKEDTFN